MKIKVKVTEDHIKKAINSGYNSTSCPVALALKDMGYTKIGNLTHGIVSYGGKIER